MNESNEVPTYKAPAGVHGPTLGRDLPDGCERCLAHTDPREADHWVVGHGGDQLMDQLYWWRPRPFQVGDRVQLAGTVVQAYTHDCYVEVDGDEGGAGTRWFPPAALTRVVDQ